MVVGAVMQSVAAIEAEIYDVANHGPGHHLGDKVDAEAREFLRPLWDCLGREPTLQRCGLILHVLGKEAVPPGESAHQRASLLVKIRNFLVHYKSRFSPEDGGPEKLVDQMRGLKLAAPPFVSSGSNFLPYHALGAELALWSARAAHDYLSEFYERLEVSCPLVNLAELLDWPPD